MIVDKIYSLKQHYYLYQYPLTTSTEMQVSLFSDTFQLPNSFYVVDEAERCNYVKAANQVSAQNDTC